MPLPDAEATAPSDPKELINAFLLSKGMQPTNALMSQALMANAQNPGVIPGLRNMEPVVSEGDPGYTGPKTKSAGGPKADTRPIPPPPPVAPPPPEAKKPDEGSLGATIADWLIPLLGGGGAALLGRKYLSGGAAKPPVAGAETPRLEAPVDRPALPAPETKALAAPVDRPAIAAPERKLLTGPPDPMTNAIDKATAPPQLPPPPATADLPTKQIEVPRPGGAAGPKTIVVRPQPGIIPPWMRAGVGSYADFLKSLRAR